jgi:hypothetical protein
LTEVPNDSKEDRWTKGERPFVPEPFHPVYSAGETEFFRTPTNTGSFIRPIIKVGYPEPSLSQAVV